MRGLYFALVIFLAYQNVSDAKWCVDPPTDACLEGLGNLTECCKGYADWMNIYFRNVKDCQTYFHCKNSSVVLKTCPKDLVFSVKLQRCDVPRNGECGNQTTLPPETNITTPSKPTTTTEKPLDGCLSGLIDPDICCDGVPFWKDVLLKNSEDCGTYYQCVHEKPLLRFCPSGLHWSVTANRCEWPEIAGCKQTNTTVAPESTTWTTSTQWSNGTTPENVTGTTSYSPTSNSTSEITTVPTNGTTAGIISEVTTLPTTITTEFSNITTSTTNTSHATELTTPSIQTNGTTENNVTETTHMITTTKDPLDDCLYGLTNPKDCCKDVPYWKDVLLKNPKDCGTYYQCVHGEPVLRPCPSGLHWSVIANRCEWPEIAQCNNTNTTKAPETTTWETTTQENNETTSSSTTEKSTVTTTSVQNNGTTPGNGSETTTPMSNTSTEIITATWKTTTQNSNETTTISTPTAPSNQTNETTITTYTPTTTTEVPLNDCLNGVIDPEVCCKGVPYWKDILLKNPKDCGTYYQCVHGEPVLRPCPSGLHWSVIANRCEWPAIAQCNESNTTKAPKTTTWETTTQESNETTSSSTTEISTVTTTSVQNNGTTPGNGSETTTPMSTTSTEIITTTWKTTTQNSNGTTTISTPTAPSNQTNETTITTNTPTTTTEIPLNDCLNGVIDPEVCCKGVPYWQDILLKNPKDCGTYYQCVHGKPVLRPCPSGLHWSVIANRCEWPEIAQCNGTNTTKAPETTTWETKTQESNETTISSTTEISTVTTTSVQNNGTTPGNGSEATTPISTTPTEIITTTWKTTTQNSNETTTISTPTAPSNQTNETTITTNTPTTTTEVPLNDCLNGVIDPEVCCKGVPYWKDILLKNPKDCGTYFQCVHGEPVLRPCPSGLHWSVIANRCEWPEIARCNETNTTKAPETTTWKTTTQNSNETTTISTPTAPSNQTNVTTISTNTPTTTTELPLNDCLNAVIDPEVCCKGVPYWKDILLKNPKDCGTYFQCVHGKPVLRPCPSGLHWSVIANRCEWPEIARCNETNTTKAPETTPWETTTQESNETTRSSTTEISTVTKTSVQNNGTTPGNSSETTTPVSTITTEIVTPTIPSNQTNETTIAANTPSTTTKIPFNDCLNGVIDPEVCCKGVPYWKDVLLKNPKDCGTYYQCVHEKPLLRPCPSGLHWSVVANRCEWPNIAKCEETMTTIKVSTWTTTLKTTDAIPSIFITKTSNKNNPANTNSTTSDKKTRATMPNTTTNIPETTIGEVPLDDCLKGLIDPEICCKDVPYWKDVLLKNPKDCGTYYQCDNEKPVLRFCSTGLHWSVAENRCELPNIANC